MSEENKPQIDEEQWVKSEHGKVLDYCSRNELNIARLIQGDSVILPPAVAIWLADSKVSKQRFWIISGDLPTDHLQADIAKNARDALRHFALRWQLKAENLLQQQAHGQPQLGDAKTQSQFANELINKADGLYELYENDSFWVNSQI